MNLKKAAKEVKESGMTKNSPTLTSPKLKIPKKPLDVKKVEDTKSQIELPDISELERREETGTTVSIIPDIVTEAATREEEKTELISATSSLSCNLPGSELQIMKKRKDEMSAEVSSQKMNFIDFQKALDAQQEYETILNNHKNTLIELQETVRKKRSASEVNNAIDERIQLNQQIIEEHVSTLRIQLEKGLCDVIKKSDFENYVNLFVAQLNSQWEKGSQDLRIQFDKRFDTHCQTFLSEQQQKLEQRLNEMKTLLQGVEANTLQGADFLKSFHEISNMVLQLKQTIERMDSKIHHIETTFNNELLEQKLQNATQHSKLEREIQMLQNSQKMSDTNIIDMREIQKVQERSLRDNNCQLSTLVEKCQSLEKQITRLYEHHQTLNVTTSDTENQLNLYISKSEPIFKEILVLLEKEHTRQTEISDLQVAIQQQKDEILLRGQELQEMNQYQSRIQQAQSVIDEKITLFAQSFEESKSAIEQQSNNVNLLRANMERLTGDLSLLSHKFSEFQGRLNQDTIKNISEMCDALSRMDLSQHNNNTNRNRMAGETDLSEDFRRLSNEALNQEMVRPQETYQEEKKDDVGQYHSERQIKQEEDDVGIRSTLPSKRMVETQETFASPYFRVGSTTQNYIPMQSLITQQPQNTNLGAERSTYSAYPQQQYPVNPSPQNKNTNMGIQQQYPVNPSPQNKNTILGIQQQYPVNPSPQNENTNLGFERNTYPAQTQQQIQVIPSPQNKNINLGSERITYSAHTQQQSQPNPSLVKEGPLSSRYETSRTGERGMPKTPDSDRFMVAEKNPLARDRRGNEYSTSQEGGIGYLSTLTSNRMPEREASSTYQNPQIAGTGVTHSYRPPQPLNTQQPSNTILGGSETQQQPQGNLYLTNLTPSRTEAPRTRMAESIAENTPSSRDISRRNESFSSQEGGRSKITLTKGLFKP